MPQSRVLRLLAPLLAACLLAPAQTPAPQQSTPVIKMTTRQVQLSVIVHDKKGHPIVDLKKEDFVLLDKGRPQEIRYFVMETAQPTSAPEALPPGVFSNRVTGSDGQQRAALPNSLTMILLDGLNARYQDRAAARAGLMKFLSELHPDDRVAVYTLTNELRVLHDFNSDVAVLRQKSAALDRFLSESISPTVMNFPQLRPRMTLDALRVIAQHVAGIPGRKNLVWLSDGFPIEFGRRANGRMSRNFESFIEEERSTMKLLDDAGVAIYPVDARGLMGSFDTSPSMAPSTPPRGRRARAAMDAQAQFDINATQGNLQSIADATGGVAFMNTNDLGRAIRQAVDDSSVSYVISFSPNHDKWDGTFHEIKIKLNRPGVEARYRKGYVAAEEKEETPETRAASLFNAAASALPSTGIGLAGRTYAPSAPVKVRVVVDAHDLSFTHRDDGALSAGAWDAKLDLLLVLLDASGNIVTRTGQTYTLALKQQQYDEAMKIGLPMDVAAPAESANVKATKARVVVRDISSKAVGTLDLPLGNIIAIK